ncbi:MAG: UvrD-helicase domain-containing protein, partial [Myxococcota bacterium]|nr:UvrD-helicase domain-containing protein [Myxococcota bacterium]
MKPLSDAEQRQEALSPEESFIVQAPAGAGKTELLIQRFLVLLARVNEPEEVLAITFTRKAAAEMRSRILEAIEKSAGPEPLEAHELKTWSLGREVMLRDQNLGWSILNNPSRLRVQTIDSFCAFLARQMPWLSRFGTDIELVEYADEYYRYAARQCLRLLSSQENKALETLLLLRDNDVGKLENLLVAMLRKRDQWLRHLTHDTHDEVAMRHVLDASLKVLSEEALSQCVTEWPTEIHAEMLELTTWAAGNFEAGSSQSPIAVFAHEPSDQLESMPSWSAMAELFLSKKGLPRKKVDKRQGFPAAGKNASAEEQELFKAQKKRFTELSEKLQDEVAFCEAMHTLRELPPIYYADDQWEILRSTFELLNYAEAELRVVFSREGKTDFVAVALAALTALGDDGSPTDLALALDYKIQHILVDEFQDTSFTQFDLLERLVAGWEEDDGRTLFLVGDPMQSIYRFREAEVGLFLRVQKEGLGLVRLKPLRLNTNFRSTPNLVGWVNNVFSDVFPKDADMLLGKVPFAASQAHIEEEQESEVVVHRSFSESLSHGAHQDPARTIVSIIKDEQTKHPERSIALLVRSRGHLKEILPALQQADLAYKAVDIDVLAERCVVQDLFALTRALYHRADRSAWLAVLRAPWCGMTLADLHQVSLDNTRTILWDVLVAGEWKERLSPESQERLERALNILNDAMQHTGRVSWQHLVKATWCRLGGPSLCDDMEIGDARAYLDLLADCTDQSESLDMTLLAARLKTLYAQPNALADERLQIMTIHKAKGLEFDTVLLPCLERRGVSGDKDLLVWLEKSEGRHSGLLLGAMGDAGGEEDPVHSYLHKVNHRREYFEDARLLYVAMTRAKHKVHLLGGVELDAKDAAVKKPNQTSLLAHLWRALEEGFVAQEHGNRAESDISELSTGHLVLKRLPLSWRRPELLPEVGIEAHAEEVDKEEGRFPHFDWAGERVRHVGTLSHQMLKIISDQGVENWSAQRVASYEAYYALALKGLGVVDDEVPRAVQDVQRALNNTLDDEKGRWILHSHEKAFSEKGMTGILDGKVRHVVIDRTFVDAQGCRWIVDYKLSVHRGADLEAFVQREVDR